MRRLVLCLILIVSTAHLSGCATIFTQGEFWRGDTHKSSRMMLSQCRDVYIYRGTALDLGIWGWITGLREHEADGQDGIWVTFLFDLPLSLVADTMLLPLTISQQLGLFGEPDR